MAELTNTSKVPQGGKVKRTTLKPGKVDLTAMVDLAFLLITFFMLTTSLNQPNSLHVAMPDKSPPPEIATLPDNRTVHLVLAEHGKVLWYYGKTEEPIIPPDWIDMGSTGLRNMLLQMKSHIAGQTAGKDIIVLIKPLNESTTQDMVSALDEMEITGVKRFMLTKPLPQDLQYVRL